MDMKCVDTLSTDSTQTKNNLTSILLMNATVRQNCSHSSTIMTLLLHIKLITTK